MLRPNGKHEGKSGVSQDVLPGRLQNKYPKGDSRTRLEPMKRKMTATEQSVEFKKMARELGADESPEAFDKTLRRIAPGAPAPLSKRKAASKK